MATPSWNDDYEKKQRAWEAHRKSIDVLFSNQNFFITKAGRKFDPHVG